MESSEEGLSAEFASAWARLAGFLVDLLATWLAVLATISIATALEADPVVWLLCGIAGYVVVRVLNTLLTVRSGQSIGKIVCRTRVVRADGAPLSVRTVVVREWTATLFDGFFRISTGVPWVHVLDGAALFTGSRRQTLHDLLAGTVVLKAP